MGEILKEDIWGLKGEYSEPLDGDDGPNVRGERGREILGENGTTPCSTGLHSCVCATRRPSGTGQKVGELKEEGFSKHLSAQKAGAAAAAWKEANPLA